MQATNRLRELRLAAGLTQAKLAAELGVDLTTITRWETLRGGIPDSRKAELAVRFGVTRPFLMGWDEDVAA